MFADFNHSSHRKIDLSGSSRPSFVRGRLSGRSPGTGVLGAAATAVSNRSSLLEYQRRERQLRERHRKCVDAALKIQKHWRSSSARSAAKARERHEFDAVLDEILLTLPVSGPGAPSSPPLDSATLSRASFPRLQSALPRLILQLAFFFDAEAEDSSGGPGEDVKPPGLVGSNLDFFSPGGRDAGDALASQPAGEDGGAGSRECEVAPSETVPVSRQRERRDADRLRILCECLLLLCRAHEQRRGGTPEEQKREKDGTQEGCSSSSDSPEAGRPSPVTTCLICLAKRVSSSGCSCLSSSCSPVLAAFRLRLLLQCASLRYHALLFQYGAPPSLRTSRPRRSSSAPGAPPQTASPSSSSVPASTALSSCPPMAAAPQRTDHSVPFQTGSHSPAKVPRLRTRLRFGENHPSSAPQKAFSRTHLRPVAGWRGSVLGSSLSLRRLPCIGEQAQAQQEHQSEGSALATAAVSSGRGGEEAISEGDRTGRSQQPQATMAYAKDRWGPEEHAQVEKERRRDMPGHPPLLLVPASMQPGGGERGYLTAVFHWVEVVFTILLRMVPRSTAGDRSDRNDAGTEEQSLEGLRSVMRPSAFSGGRVLTAILGDALAYAFRTGTDLANWGQTRTLIQTSVAISVAYNGTPLRGAPGQRQRLQSTQ